MNGASEAIKRFILEKLAPHIPEEDLREDLPLFGTKIVDSISVVELVCFLEDRFKIKVKAPEIVLENFDSIDALSRFVEKKQTVPSPERPSQ